MEEHLHLLGRLLDVADVVDDDGIESLESRDGLRELQVALGDEKLARSNCRWGRNAISLTDDHCRRIAEVAREFGTRTTTLVGLRKENAVRMADGHYRRNTPWRPMCEAFLRSRAAPTMPSASVLAARASERTPGWARRPFSSTSPVV